MVAALLGNLPVMLWLGSAKTSLRQTHPWFGVVPDRFSSITRLLKFLWYRKVVVEDGRNEGLKSVETQPEKSSPVVAESQVRL